MQDKLRPPALFNFAYPGTGLLVLFFSKFDLLITFFSYRVLSSFVP